MDTNITSTASLNPGVNAVLAIAKRLPTTPFGNSLRATATRLADGAEALIEARRHPDASRSDAFNGAASVAATDLFRKTITKAQDDFAAAIGRARTAATTEQDAKAQLIPDEHARETREIFRGFGAGERAKFVQSTIDRKDAPTLAAITEVPPHLAGLSGEQQRQFRDSFIEKHAASNTAKELDEIAGAAKTVFDTLMKV